MKKLKCFVLLVVIFLPSHLLAASQDDTVTFAFVGDIMLARSCGRKIVTAGLNYPLAKVKSILSSADLAFGNLEGALVGSRVTGSSRAFIFCSPPRFGQVLINGGIDVVTLANNHANDGGRQGIVRTIETLDNLGIRHVGAGRNIQEARSLATIDVKGKKIGFLGYTDLANIGLARAAATENRPGVALVSLSTLASDIRQAKTKVDFLIVSFHWGIEYRTQPTDRQRLIARKSIDAGADIIIGHHPHVLEPIESYRSKTIAYSLGNFVFDNHRPSRAKTMILWIEWRPNPGGQIVKMIPCYIRACRPEVVSR